MRKMMMALLLASTIAAPVAARPDQSGWRDRSDAEQTRQENRRDREAIRKGRAEVRDDVRRGDYTEARRDMRDLQRDEAERQRDRTDAHRDWRRDNDGRHDWNRQRDWDRNGSWNRGWRNDQRFNWDRWRDAHRDRYRLPRYHAPRYHSYQRWMIGIRIDPWFYGRSYWINDPWYYRLPPAHGPYRWVRYYDDAMLVDVRSGIIVDIIYDFFW